MGVITTRPDPHGNPDRIDILEDGEFFVNCPVSHYQKCVDHHINTTFQHFAAIAERQQQQDPTLVIAIDSRYGLTAYSIGSEHDNPKGFGGDNWIIRFHDGREVKSSSLWCMGQIPEEWKPRIVENATLAVKNPWHTKEYPL